MTLMHCPPATLALAGSLCLTLALILASLGNPLGFLALAIKPDLSQRPASAFGAFMTICFMLTTIGYGGAAWTVARGDVPRPLRSVGRDIGSIVVAADRRAAVCAARRPA